MSNPQSIFGLLLFLIIIFSMNMIFGNVLRDTFTTNRNIGMPSPSVNQLKKTLNGNNTGRMSHQTQNDDQPLYFGFPL